MSPELFPIKSLWVQDAIMLTAIGVVAALFIRAVLSRSVKGMIAFGIWAFIVAGFFNSPFFGFSAVRISSGGIGLEYGILSFRNTTLPLSTRWKIESYLGGIRKTRRLYAIRIGDRESMRVKGEEDRERLQKIGEAIDQARTRFMKTGQSRHVFVHRCSM
jgi:hypothetical protein